MTPDRIHVERRSRLRWKNTKTLDAMALELARLGYEDDGPHVIVELPGWNLRCFYHSGTAAFAVIFEELSQGAWLDLYSRYEAGQPTRSCAASNTRAPQVGALDKPPGVLRE